MCYALNLSAAPPLHRPCTASALVRWPLPEVQATVPLRKPPRAAFCPHNEPHSCKLTTERHRATDCLREARCTIEKQKPIALMFDPVRGGAALEVLRDEEQLV